MAQDEARLAECFRLLEETGDVERCFALYPDLQEEIELHLQAFEALAALKPAPPPASSAATSRRLLLSSLATEPETAGWLRRNLPRRFAPALTAMALLIVATAGAGAAGGGVSGPGLLNEVLSQLGIVDEAEQPADGDNHGSNVSGNVHEAIESSTPGEGRGAAVSEAACEAAHDRSTLPTPAQGAAGQEGSDPKDCGDGDEDGAGADEPEDANGQGDKDKGKPPDKGGGGNESGHGNPND